MFFAVFESFETTASLLYVSKQPPSNFKLAVEDTKILDEIANNLEEKLNLEKDGKWYGYDFNSFGKYVTVGNEVIYNRILKLKKK